MLIESVFSAVIAVFAVFGVYCTLKMFFGNFYSNVPAAVILEPSDDIEILKIKIKDAESLCLCGRCEIIILIPECRENDTTIMNYVENKGYMYLYYKC